MVTLHVGPGTFLPVRAADTDAHRMYAERGAMSRRPPMRCAARAAGGRIVAVGTTTLRLWKAPPRADGIHPFAGETSLFIAPGYRFSAVDLLLTNFHLPRSTLFMLVSAFSGRRPCSPPTPRHRGRLSLLLLRRRLPPLPGAGGERLRLSRARPPMARRERARSPCRAGIRTPAFMPVGTAGTVKAMLMDGARGSGPMSSSPTPTT